MKRKIISCLLSFAMIFSLLPLNAFAAAELTSIADGAITSFKVGGQSITSFDSGTGNSSDPYKATVKVADNASFEVEVTPQSHGGETVKYAFDANDSSKPSFSESLTYSDSSFKKTVTNSETGTKDYLWIEFDADGQGGGEVYFAIKVEKASAVLTALVVDDDITVSGDLSQTNGTDSAPIELTASLKANAANFKIKATFTAEEVKYSTTSAQDAKTGTSLTSDQQSADISTAGDTTDVYIYVKDGSAENYYKLTVTNPSADKAVLTTLVVNDDITVEGTLSDTNGNESAPVELTAELTENAASFKIKATFDADTVKYSTTSAADAKSNGTELTTNVESSDINTVADGGDTDVYIYVKDGSAENYYKLTVTNPKAAQDNKTTKPQIQGASDQETVTVTAEKGNMSAKLTVTNKDAYTEAVTVEVKNEEGTQAATGVTGTYDDGTITLKFTQALEQETTYQIILKEGQKESSDAVKVTVKPYAEKTATPTVPAEGEKIVANQGNTTATVAIENADNYTGTKIEVKVYTDNNCQSEASGVTGTFTKANDGEELSLTFPKITAETTYYITFKEDDKTASEPAKLIIQPVTTTPTTDKAEVTADDNKTFKVTISNKTEYENGTVAVAVYSDDKAQTTASGVTGAYEDGTLTLTFNSAITADQKVYVVFTYTPSQGQAWAPSGTLAVTAKHQAKTDTPVFGGEVATQVTCEKGNTRAVIDVTNNYPEGSTVKVYPQNSMDAVAEHVTGAYANKQITLTFDPALAQETTYQITVTESGRLESEPLVVVVKLYVADDDATITAIVDSSNDKLAAVKNTEANGDGTINSPSAYQFNIDKDGTKPTGVKLTVSPLATVKYVNTNSEISQASEITSSSDNQEGTVTITGLDFSSKQYLYVEVTAEDGTTKLYYKITVKEQPVKPGDPDTDLNVANPDDKTALESLLTTGIKTDSVSAVDQEILNVVSQNSEVLSQIENAGTFAEASSKPETVWGKLYAASEGNIQDGTLNFFYVPVLDMEVPADGYNAENKTLTLDITPKYIVIATTAESSEDAVTADETETASEVNAVMLTEEPIKVELTNVTLEIAIPTGIASDGEKVYIQHESDPQQECEVNSGKATITVPSFSTFKISKEANGPAIVNGQVYDSVQAAIDAVANSGKVELTNAATAKDLEGLKAPTQLSNGQKFTIDKGTSALEEQIKKLELAPSTANGKQYTAKNNNNGEFTITEKQLYNLNINTSGSGTLTADAKQYAEGDKVTLTVGSGTLESLTVMGDTAITTDPESVTGSTKTITFTMPAHDVTVTATFKSTSHDGSSGGGGGVSSSATVTTPAATNGSYTVSDKNAKAGDTVKVTPKANKGYVVDQVTVTDKNGKAVSVKDNGDGTYSFVMPEKAVQPVTVKVTFKLDTSSAADKFTDVDKNAWYIDAVNYVVEKGLMEGTGATTFAPNATTSRAMIVTILYRLEGEPGVTKDVKFTDVASGQWYSDAINWAATNGIVNGYGENKFGPNDNVTREQMTAILYRYASYKGYNVSGQANLNGYTDANTINDWATNAMRWAVSAGLIQGTSNTTISPVDDSTRAQIATVLMRFCENIAK